MAAKNPQISVPGRVDRAYLVSCNPTEGFSKLFGRSLVFSDIHLRQLSSVLEASYHPTANAYQKIDKSFKGHCPVVLNELIVDVNKVLVLLYFRIS